MEVGRTEKTQINGMAVYYILQQNRHGMTIEAAQHVGVVQSSIAERDATKKH